MPTYTWTRTREQAADMVLRKLGVLGAADAGDASDLAVVYEAMNARLKELSALSELWWNIAGAQTDVPVTSGSNTATIAAADYLFPVSARLVVGTEQRELSIIGHREYQAIPDKATTGEPVSVFISGAVCKFYPVPNVSSTLKLTYEAIAADVEAGQAPDVPPAALRSFVALVAGDLVDEFGLPAERAMRLVAGQQQAMRVIRMVSMQRVDSTPVTPEYF